MQDLKQNPLYFPEIDKHFQFSISCVICDAPARSYVMQPKGHSGSMDVTIAHKDMLGMGK